jgi:hypothetical protein
MVGKAVLMAAALAAGVWAQSGTSLYVAKSGNDADAGTKAHPFATFERARDEARRRKTAGKPVTVYVRQGVYTLERTLRLTAEDSGTAAAPVTWRAYPGESVTLSGGVPITGFTPWRGKIRQAAYRGAPVRQLFYGGRRQPLARYPNYDASNPYGGGWAYADGKLVDMYENLPSDDKRTLGYKSADARGWAHPEDGEVTIFPRYNWWNNIVRIKSIDRTTRAITLAGECSYAIRPGDRYFVQGMLEELDAPGEWYLDSRAGTLYFWPPEGSDSNPTVYVPHLGNVLELAAGTAYVTFRGFTIEHAASTAVVLNNATHCLIAGNTIRNSGDYRGSGVAVNGGSQNGVAGNDIYEIGANGIAIAGGDRITLTAAENYAGNNYIHHTGVLYKQGVGISLIGCGNRASHNLIHDTPRMAILFDGNNLVIEYNHIRHVNLETADTGAVYTGGRDWISSRGTVVRYNYMHDSLGYGHELGKWMSPYYSWGIYLDDNAGGVDVIGNIVVRAYRGLIHLHNGRDNLVENNVFIDGKRQQAEFNGWLNTSTMWTDHLPTMIAGYNSVKDQPAWKGMRNMGIGPEQAVLPGGLIMSGNVLRRNIVYWTDPQAKLYSSRNLPIDHNVWDRNLYWNGGGALTVALGGKLGDVDFAAWQKAGADVHSVVADPRFVDAAHGDYRLRPDSPALKLGFHPIPVDKIGPYRDELRASWPIVEAEGAREHPLR